MFKLSHKGILTALATVGREVSILASPGYYLSYQNENARRYFPILTATRKAYAEIRDGGDADVILKNLHPLLDRAQQISIMNILDAMHDNLSQNNQFIVIDGFLCYRTGKKF